MLNGNDKTLQKLFFGGFLVLVFCSSRPRPDRDTEWCFFFVLFPDVGIRRPDDEKKTPTLLLEQNSICCFFFILQVFFGIKRTGSIVCCAEASVFLN